MRIYLALYMRTIKQCSSASLHAILEQFLLRRWSWNISTFSARTWAECLRVSTKQFRLHLDSMTTFTIHHWKTKTQTFVLRLTPLHVNRYIDFTAAEKVKSRRASVLHIVSSILLQQKKPTWELSLRVGTLYCLFDSSKSYPLLRIKHRNHSIAQFSFFGKVYN